MKRILSVLILAVMLFGCMMIPAGAETDKVGTEFTADEYYAIEKPFTKMPV